ncbi:MAG: hypothetical protein ACRC2R_23895 [Xenococcaceae cyanobacterium]
MSHFNLKSLAFYGVAIGSVLVLFKGVTAYGESNLKAPDKIGGVYRLETQNLPDCLRSQDLVVHIEQSGIYLFGDLSEKSETETDAKNESDRLHVPLEGKFRESGLSVSGKLNKLNSCQQLASANDKDAFAITGKVEDKIFSGKIAWNNNFPDTSFTAKLDESENSQEKE